jgi:hypothetical protein
VGKNEVNTEELKQYLESRRKSLSEQEYFELIFNMLEQDPPEESRDILRAWFTAFSHVDPDRVARYWEPFLSDPDPFWREAAALQLVQIFHERNSLADHILSNHLGVEVGKTTAEEQLDMIMRRLRNLFPGQDDEGIQI